MGAPFDRAGYRREARPEQLERGGGSASGIDWIGWLRPHFGPEDLGLAVSAASFLWAASGRPHERKLPELEEIEAGVRRRRG